MHLSETYDNESNELYEQTVVSLSKWFDRQSKKYNSSDFYVFENPVFRDLYFNPTKHLEYAIKYITKPEGDLKVKKLIIKTLQCLSFERYLSLGELILKMNDDKVAMMYLSPGPEYGITLDKNYQRFVTI